MGMIYRRAGQVNVWLGDSPSATKAAWLLLKTFMASHIWPPRELYKKLVDERDSPSWLALIELFNHPWFSRVWVIQEVAVASKVRLIYGGWVIHWDMLLSCLKLFVQPELQVLLTTTEDVNR